MTVRWLRALSAAVLSLALLVGLPLLLIRLIGSPLHTAQDLLAGDVTDQVVLAVLGVIACGAGVITWAQFTVAFVIEFASGVRRTPVPARVPGVFVGQQRLARNLVTALLLLGPAVLSAVGPTAAAAAAIPSATISAPAASYRSAPDAPSKAASSAAAAPSTDDAVASVVATRTVTVTSDGPRTWWRMAEHYLGAGDQWRTLWALNDGTRQADGTVLASSTTVLRAGWTIHVPADADTAAATAPIVPASGEASRDVTIAPGDSLASVAANNGTDWVSVWAANEGREQPGGQRLTDPNYIEPGWTVRVPAADSSVKGADVSVEAGQTLSAIAAKHSIPTSSLWEANEGREQPDGQRLTDPDYVEPGWTIRLPPTAATPAPNEVSPTPSGDASDSAVVGSAGIDASGTDPASGPAESHTDVAETNASHPSAAAVPSVSAPAPTGSAGTPATGSASVSSAPAVPSSSPAGEGSSAVTGGATDESVGDLVPQMTASTAEPAIPAGPPAGIAAADPAAQGEAASEEGDSAALAMLGAGGGAVMLTAVALMAYRRARRRQFRLRRPGRAVASLPPQVARMERVVLTTGQRGFADVNWLDQALRSLVHILAAQPGAQLPDVIAVRVGREIELILASALHDAPAPWRVSNDGTRWKIRRRDALPYDEADRDFHIPPFPLLASVGYTPGGDHYLLDLERIGSVTLSGDSDRCLDLARYLAAEISHSRWSELLQVTMVGFGTEMADINPHQLSSVATLSEVSPQIEAHLRGVDEVMGETGMDVAGGRLCNVAGDTWAPHIVLVSPGVAEQEPQELVRLVDLLQQDRNTVAVVLASAQVRSKLPATRWLLTVDAEGVLTVPALGIQLVAEQLPAAEAAPLTQLLVAAGAEGDQPMPGADGDDPWDEFSDAVGNLRVPLTTTPAAATMRLAGTWPPRPHSILPLDPAVYAEAAAISERDVEVLAPGIDQEVRDRLFAADPTLEQDVADWRDETSHRIKLRLLGPVDVWSAALAPAPPGRPQKVEAVAYLATRARGAAASVVRADLWPDDPGTRPTSKVRNLMNGTRTWLGVNPATGREHLPSNAGEDRGGLYRVEGILVDAELFRRLRLRAMAHGGVEAIADLWSALTLVTGTPFEAHRPRGYGWIGELTAQYTALVADAAHTVATHHLAAGEAERAAAAAQVALLAGAQGDEVLLDLVTACHARGDRDSGDIFVRRLVDNHGEVEEDIPPATYEYLRTRDMLPRRSA